MNLVELGVQLNQDVAAHQDPSVSREHQPLEHVLTIEELHGNHYLGDGDEELMSKPLADKLDLSLILVLSTYHLNLDLLKHAVSIQADILYFGLVEVAS